MPNRNKLEIIGHIGKDPEFSKTANNKSMCKFSVATSSGKEDNRKTQWFSVTTWGDLAEAVFAEFRKGDAIMCVGPIEYREYEGKTYWGMTAFEVYRPIYKRKDNVDSEGKSETHRQTQNTADDDIPF